MMWTNVPFGRLRNVHIVDVRVEICFCARALLPIQIEWNWQNRFVVVRFALFLKNIHCVAGIFNSKIKFKTDKSVSGRPGIVFYFYIRHCLNVSHMFRYTLDCPLSAWFCFQSANLYFICVHRAYFHDFPGHFCCLFCWFDIFSMK